MKSERLRLEAGIDADKLQRATSTQLLATTKHDTDTRLTEVEGMIKYIQVNFDVLLLICRYIFTVDNLFTARCTL